MEDTPNEDDLNVNPQLTKNFKLNSNMYFT